MNKLLIVFLLNLTLTAKLAAEMYEPEDPIVWNGWNIARHYELFERGILTRDDLEAAIEQAHTRNEEEEAEVSTWTWFQEYHPVVPYLACAASGALGLWLMQKVF